MKNEVLYIILILFFVFLLGWFAFLVQECFESENILFEVQ